MYLHVTLGIIPIFIVSYSYLSKSLDALPTISSVLGMVAEGLYVDLFEEKWISTSPI